MNLDSNEKTATGPLRSTYEEASADLNRLRAASSEDEVLQIASRLKTEGLASIPVEPGGGLDCDSFGHGVHTAARSDADWFREEPGFLDDLAFNTEEAKEETRLYYHGLKMLFCFLRGSLSHEEVCHIEASLGKDFLKFQLRDVCLGLEATAHHLGEQNPFTAEEVALTIINTPTDELDTVLQMLGQCANAASG